jgi:uncharacterized membrane protein
MTASHVAVPARRAPASSIAGWLSAHWFAGFVIVYGLWVLAPFLAPVFMRLGWGAPGRTIYFIYSFFCHQLPERSFFFFGSQPMYSLGEVQAAWQNTLNPMILRQFIGNETMGWKVAWSDRMISFYTSFWIFALAWWPLRRRLKPISWVALLLFLLPMAVDGATHMLSDLSGIGQGFRDSNGWLLTLSGGSLPARFYSGDALGSFNSWARLVTGILAGWGLAWMAFPYIFESQRLTSELGRHSYGAALEQIKNQNTHSSGG